MNDVYNESGVSETSKSDSQISMLSKTFSFWIYNEDFWLHLTDFKTNRTGEGSLI